MKHIINRHHFRFDSGRMLFLRMGAASAQKQKHNRRPIDMRTLEKTVWDEERRGPYEDYVRRLPVNRGVWVFPFPFHDPFFYFHIFYRHLPKRLQEKTIIGIEDETEQEKAWSDHETALRRVRKSMKLKKIWWGGCVYSRINPCGEIGPWFCWPTPEDYADAARKHLFLYVRSGDEAFRMRYGLDHMECFLPMRAKR